MANVARACEVPNGSAADVFARSFEQCGPAIPSVRRHTGRRRVPPRCPATPRRHATSASALPAPIVRVIRRAPRVPKRAPPRPTRVAAAVDPSPARRASTVRTRRAWAAALARPRSAGSPAPERQGISGKDSGGVRRAQPDTRRSPRADPRSTLRHLAPARGVLLEEAARPALARAGVGRASIDEGEVAIALDDPDRRRSRIRAGSGRGAITITEDAALATGGAETTGATGRTGAERVSPTHPTPTTKKPTSARRNISRSGYA